MAYFAELDKKNIVIRCVSIADEDCLDAEGNESEAVGIKVCKTLFGTSKWKQTSFSGRIRRNFAGVGMLYHTEKDVFVPQPPKPWYVLNDNYEWEVPIGVHPDTGKPLQNWQWEYLDISYKVNPSYANLPIVE